MRAGGFREWLEAKDPGLVAVKRSARVTLATCVGFYFSRYVLDDAQMATFASFGCIAMGALSDVTGKPSQRTRAYGVSLLVGMILVTLGTVLAVNTWAAVAGMLVIGFLIAYAGVGGPRVVGAANGLQLLYILPSFPPYVPEALGSRLIGLIIGVGLLAIADRVLWPPPVPTPFTDRLAGAIKAVHDELLALLEPDGMRQLAAEPKGAISLRLSNIPPLQRPTGPGRRDRAAMEAATLLRGLEARVAALQELSDQGHSVTSHLEGTKLLDTTVRSLAESVAVLEGAGPDPDPIAVEAALSGYVLRREALAGVARIDHDVQIRLRYAVIAEELAIWTRDLAVATQLIRGKRVRDPATRSMAEPFWYANRSTLSLWFLRFRGHFTPRSVFFQNALRLALGLAACASGRRGARPVSRFLGAAGNAVADAHHGRGHPGRRDSSVHRNRCRRTGGGAALSVGWYALRGVRGGFSVDLGQSLWPPGPSAVYSSARRRSRSSWHFCSPRSLRCRGSSRRSA